MMVLPPVFRVVPIEDGQPRPFPLFSAQFLRDGIFRLTVGLFGLLPFFPSLNRLFAGVVWDLRGGSVEVLRGRMGVERGGEGGAVLFRSESVKADEAQQVKQRLGSASESKNTGRIV